MAGKGPRAKPESQRRRSAPTPGFRQLPRDGRTGDAPEWPMGTPSTLCSTKWDELWALPQAVMWEEQGIYDFVALYVQLWAERAMGNTDLKIITEMRQVDAKIGLSSKSMADLHWEIEPPPREKVAAEPKEEGDPGPPKTERVFVPRT